MKTLTYYLLCILALAFSTKGFTQANTGLSNLAKTSVNRNLDPKSTNTINLGASDSSWKNLFLTGSIYLDKKRFVYNPGTENNFVGTLSGNSNTIGSYNTGFGFNSLYSNTTGISNTAVGTSALFSITGDDNTGLGYYALEATTGAFFNTAIGYNAGAGYDNGYNNVFVGANTDVNGAGYFNVVAIGQGTICTASSQVTMGNFSTDSYRAYSNWSNISDGRVKKNIKQNVPGLVFINKLQPVTYNLDLDAIDKIVQYIRKDSTGKAVPYNKAEQTARLAKEKIVYTGFVAQDVEKVAKSLNYDFSGVDAAKNDKDLYGLRYGDFVVPLVKAVQELSKMSDEKDSLIDAMKNNYDAKIDVLQNQINELKSMIVANQSLSSNQSAVALADENSLQQNIPNPFTNTTNIGYALNQKFTSAQIVITDKSGRTIKAINLPAGRQGVSGGKGNVTVDASTLSSGAYQYSLVVDGRLIDTKQMVLAK
jgi:hypothetical protein